jgi:hypothetical protein
MPQRRGSVLAMTALGIPIGKESRIGGDELQGRRAAMVTTPSPEGNSYRGAHFMEL